MIRGQIHTADLAIDGITQTSITVGTSSIVVLPARQERKYMRFIEVGGGSTVIYLHFDASAATTTNAIPMSPIVSGGLPTYEEGVGVGSGMIYTGEVRAIASAGANALYVEERF